MATEKHSAEFTGFNNAMTEYATEADWTPALKMRTDYDDSEDVRTIGGNPERVKFYNENAGDYDIHNEKINYTGPAVTAGVVHKYMQGKTDASILDIGCGNGTVLRELYKLAPYSNVDGLDPSSGMLALAQAENLYHNLIEDYFKVGSAQKYHDYDLVVCCGAFVPGHLRSNGIEEMCQAARVGGYIINVMRVMLMEEDTEFIKVRPLVEKLAKEGKIEIVADYQFDDFFLGYKGHVFVLKRIF